ncbi:MAG TPA: ABC transporter C-terminal domain-containing protein, partial [Pirellulales bacterium]|nr:ABC transporter C-terminal domain-containing protein [Pirellulales bacterium]
THDRFMLDRLSTVVLGFDREQRGRLYADYRQWLAAQAEAPSQQPTPPATKKTGATPATKVAKLSYQQQRELSQIEDRIAEAEAAVTRLHESLAAAAARGDYKRLAAEGAELEAATAAVDALYRRWEALEALRSGKQA